MDSTDLPPRTLVLCFDGTGNLYDNTNTNVVKLFSMLKKDCKDEQLVYYQAGIGTYSAPGIWTTFQLWVAKEFDQAIAWYIDAHVMGGYKFLMQNYRTGDRICLFGFSRGAYTARALAGMLYKVGLLPRDNEEQVGFAYKMYKSTGKNNETLAAGFKQAFCRPVPIEFIGCWDTVSSVGLFWGRHLPFTSGNTSIKRFRHALSLDERRAKFQPNLWHRDAPDDSGARLDPEHGSSFPIFKKLKSKDTEKRASPSRRSVAAEEPITTDVCEVWFAGCHSDIGGGETTAEVRHTLSNISLRWMIREIIDAQCGIQFDDHAIERLGIPLPTVAPDGSVVIHVRPATGSSKEKDGASVSSLTQNLTEANEDAIDAVQDLHDELKLTPIWWVLEVVPLFVSWQDHTGKWHRAFRWNLGRGRKVDLEDPKLHTTVQTRKNDKSLGYKPRATWAANAKETWVT